MRFKISRTSQIFDIEESNKKPCDEAFLENKIWVVEINTLEDLIIFIENHPRIVIEKEFYSNEIDIEIYDDYRE